MMQRRRQLLLSVLSLFTTAFFLLLSLRVEAERPLDVYYHANADTKKIALTFDDGPHPRYTDQILSLLEEEGVRATFFVIGANIALYPAVAQRVIEAGHEIGNHTYSHPRVPMTTSEQIEEEIGRTDRILLEHGCEKTDFFRPPQGICPTDLPRLLERTGKIAILWNIDTRDWAHRAAAEIVREVEDRVSGGDIILFHDYVSGENTTIPALKKLIPTLKARGYQFVTVSELLMTSEG